MKIKKSTLLTSILFLVIVGLGFFMLPLTMHITNPSTIIYEKTNVTNDFLLSAEDTSSRIFEPNKKNYMEKQLDPNELEFIYSKILSYNLPLSDTDWVFNSDTVYFTNDTKDYIYNSYFVAMYTDADKTITYVFNPYTLYIAEHVERPITLPSSSQIQVAYKALQYDSSFSSEKLISYSKELERLTKLYVYQGNSYIQNSLYYFMYMNKNELSTSFFTYNHTKSYSFLDCMKLGDKTIQFDGTLFAVTYFKNEYGIILYYNPITQDYCGYSIVD